MAELQAQEASVRWQPASKEVSLGVEEHPLLEDVTQQLSKD
jgi:hypothetical protein